MTRWRAIAGAGNRSKLLGPIGVVLAIVVGGALPVALSAAAPASSLAAQPPVSTCSPPTITTPTPPTVPPKVPVTTTTTGTVPVTVPPLCPPTLTAVPSAELADGQSITVTGTGFTPNEVVGMAECAAGALNPSECDLSTVDEVQTDSTGAFSIDYSVTRIIYVNDTNIDCALTPCLLGAADVSDYSVAASASIGFNPNIPPALTGAVSPTGKVNTTTGTAVITGTVTCTEPTLVEVDVELDQTWHRFNFTDDGYTEVNCTAKKKGNKWSLSIPPGVGLFGVGKATVQVDLEGQIGESFRDYQFSANVVLQSKK
jgi:hypothetical protein